MVHLNLKAGLQVHLAPTFQVSVIPLRNRLGLFNPCCQHHTLANLHFKAHADEANIFTHLWNAIVAELFYNKCTDVENSERGTASWPWGSLPRAGPSPSWNTQQVFRIALILH